MIIFDELGCGEEPAFAGLLSCSDQKKIIHKPYNTCP
jgi:hypothetical protein